MSDDEYLRYLLSLGFDRNTAEEIVEGRNIDGVLTREEFLSELAAVDSHDKLSNEFKKSTADIG